MTAVARVRRLTVLGTLLAGLTLTLMAFLAAPAHASPGSNDKTTAQSSNGSGSAKSPVGPSAPQGPATPTTVKIQFPGAGGKPSQSLVIILAITVLAIAPALLMLVTSFTKVVVVLSLTRNALGLQSVPPNQVLAGLALFLSLFIMAPTLSKVYDAGVKPYLHGEKTQSQAWDDGVKPLKGWMLDHTRQSDLAVFVSASHSKQPETRDDVSLPTLVPAFVISELKSAFIIGFVIFLPFLLIDLVVSSSLMSLGMMMVPPVMVSLPFKLLLFVLVDGWVLISQALVRSYA
jgi:flagellar biosynthetic protein FliP